MGYPESVTEALANVYGDVADVRAPLAEGATGESVRPDPA